MACYWIIEKKALDAYHRDPPKDTDANYDYMKHLLSGKNVLKKN